MSVFSAGELDPSFGGTGAAPYVSVSGGDYTLVDPETRAHPAAIFSDLTSLRVIAVARRPERRGRRFVERLVVRARFAAPGPTPTAGLPNPPPASVTVGANTYDGEELYAFLDPKTTGVSSDIVVTAATDGYLAVFSLAELLIPVLGGNPDNLLAYAGATFPGAGLARIVTPTDNMHGRWNSNLDLIAVVNAPVPELPSWAMLLEGFAGLGLVARRARRYSARGGVTTRSERRAGRERGAPARFSG